MKFGEVTTEQGAPRMSRLTQKVIGAALILAAVLVGAGSASAEGAHNYEHYKNGVYSRGISMGSGRSIIVDLPMDVAEIVVGNPQVADAVVRTPRKIYVMGVDSGQTTILGIDSSGRQVADIEVSIGRDVGELGPLLKAALPKSEITARTINDTIILTGVVASAAEAQRAVDIAKGFAARASATKSTVVTGGLTQGSVVNALSIRGEDQVMLKVTVAEVERKIIKQLGFSTAYNGESLLHGSWGSFVQENPFAINPTMSKTALTINGHGGTTATLKAFERYGVSRILAEPSVTAVSGEAAKMLVGGEIAVPSSGTCGYGGSATGTSYYCTPGITFKPYGVSLNFTPVVLSEGRIQLHLATEVTEIDLQNSFTYASVAIPGFKTRKNETTVELPSGGSIATAGLLTQTSAQAINGLPGLLNLPVLGTLFRSRDYQRNETELLVIVTPYIVKAVSSKDVTLPDENFQDASDPQAWLLGRVNRLYSTRSNPKMMENFKGRIGFIHD